MIMREAKNPLKCPYCGRPQPVTGGVCRHCSGGARLASAGHWGKLLTPSGIVFAFLLPVIGLPLTGYFSAPKERAFQSAEDFFLIGTIYIVSLLGLVWFSRIRAVSMLDAILGPITAVIVNALIIVLLVKGFH